MSNDIYRTKGYTSWREVIAAESEDSNETHLPAMHSPDYIFMQLNREKGTYTLWDKNDHSDPSLENLTEEQVDAKLKEWDIDPEAGWL